MAIDNSTDLRALAILALTSEEPLHAYEMQKRIRDRHKDFATMTTRTLYHTVDRLVKEGWITPVETNREGNRPERTIYAITPTGQDELTLWLTELLSTPSQDPVPFTAAISLMTGLPRDTALAALQHRVLLLVGHIAEIDAQLTLLTDQLPRVFLLEEELIRTLRTAELEWVRGVVNDLQADSLTWKVET